MKEKIMTKALKITETQYLGDPYHDCRELSLEWL